MEPTLPMNDPFETEGAEEAFKLACRHALEANYLLLDFMHTVMSAGEPTAPRAAIQAAGTKAKQAEAAWTLFARLSAPAEGQGQASSRHEIGGMKH